METFLATLLVFALFAASYGTIWLIMVNYYALLQVLLTGAAGIAAGQKSGKLTVNLPGNMNTFVASIISVALTYIGWYILIWSA